MSGDPLVETFDLTCRPWLPVLRDDGSEDELSLVEVFAQADRLRRLVGDVPTQEFALLRLLLAILHDAVEGPGDLDHWQQLWEDGIPLGAPTESTPTCSSTADGSICCTRRPRSSRPRDCTPRRTRSPRWTGWSPTSPTALRSSPCAPAAWSGCRSPRPPAGWCTHTPSTPPGSRRARRATPESRAARSTHWAWAGRATSAGSSSRAANLRETLLLNLIAFDTDNLRIDADADRPAWRHPPPGPAEHGPARTAAAARQVCVTCTPGSLAASGSRSTATASTAWCSPTATPWPLATASA